MLKSKNKYLRFVANACLYLLIIIFFDQMFGRTLQHYYFTTSSGDYYRTTYAMDSTNAEIIILGSSRATHHYIPKLIEDSLRMSCYNTGRDGNFILFNFAIFKSIIKRYNPKIVILDINQFDLYQADNTYEKLSALLPYYYRNSELRNIIELRGKEEKYKMASAIYPFNSSIINIVKGHLESYHYDDFRGYVPLYGSNLHNKKPTMAKESINEYDNNKLNAIDTMALICSKKNIKFIVVQSPSYIIEKQENGNRILISRLEKYKVTYLNFSNDTNFLNNSHLFKDGLHLNNEGAYFFTNKITHEIKKAITKG